MKNSIMGGCDLTLLLYVLLLLLLKSITLLYNTIIFIYDVQLPLLHRSLEHQRKYTFALRTKEWKPSLRMRFPF